VERYTKGDFLMAKKVTVIWHDFYHPKEAIAPMIDEIFASDIWEVTKTMHLRDVVNAAERPDLVMFYTPGLTEGEEKWTYAELQKIVDMVADGMGIMFCHAGMVWADPECPFTKELNCGDFISHPARKGENLVHAEQCMVTNIPLMDVNHPITEGIEPFAAIDEHYFVAMDPSRTQLLACASSEHGVTTGVWAHEYGKGRVACITEGHDEVMKLPMMRKLTKNAAEWCTRQK